MSGHAGGLLRVATAGSVDDGKSTLIGRLLVDSHQVLSDQLESVRGLDGELNLAHLTDGLRSEREQGITIDVAYRYFATAARRFILADSPGHEEYTRNMVTGASRADALLVLLDARHGVVGQTRRHLAVGAMLRVPHIVLVVNKMDAVDYDAERFAALEAEFRALAGQAGVPDVRVVPISALKGDNVVARSAHTPFYDGPPLLELLESLPTDPESEGAARLPVQVVLDHEGRRLAAGQLARGRLRAGNEVVVAPGGRRTRIRALEVLGEPAEAAAAPRSIAVELEDDAEVRRGDVIVAATGEVPSREEVVATVCWMAEPPLRTGDRLLAAGAGTTAPASVEVLGGLDVKTLGQRDDVDELTLNDIGRVRLRFERPLALDPYAESRYTGSLILVDEATNATTGAALVEA